jgi:hypothetical protein
MKKTTILLLLFSTGILVADAQNKASKEKTNSLNFGLRAGANFSNIIKDGDNNFSSGIKAGFNAGAFLEIPVVNGFSIQPELQFSQKGYTASGSFLGSAYEYKTTTNFIEIPVLARFSPSKDFAIIAGPQFSFLTSTKTKFSSGTAVYENTVNEDNNNLRKNILGGILGIEAVSNNVVFGLRYNLDFQANNGDGTNSTPKYKNQVLGLSIGFRF